VIPTLATAQAAAASIEWAPDTDFRVSITNAPGANAYPISSFTWLLIYRNSTKPETAAKLRDFLRWMLTPAAQAQAERLHYAPLPPVVAKLVAARLPVLRANGRPIP
jgi:phosphate transport system substrate-binding protein